MSLLSLDEYCAIAEKMLLKRGLPLDDEAISYIVEFMVKAEDKFDGRGCLIKYRGRQGWYGLTRWLRKRKRQRREVSLNTILCNNDHRHLHLVDTIADTKDNKSNEVIDNITNANYLSTRDKDMVFGYYLQNMTYDELGSKYSISKQRAEQIVSKALSKIRKFMDVTED